MERDWCGNNNSVFVCNGASNYSNNKREFMDYYATETKALSLLLNEEKFNNKVWECACGELHLSNILKQNGYDVKSSDIVDRLHNGQIEQIDFLNYKGKWDGDIITNPPYKYAQKFVQKSLDIIPQGSKVAMLLKLTFLESKSRRNLFNKYPFKTLYVSSSRLQCAKNGDFNKYKNGTGTAVAYGWYIWVKGFKGNPRIKWFN